jgi:hypothetical protein
MRRNLSINKFDNFVTIDRIFSIKGVVIMNKKENYDLYIFKKTTFLGICIGFIILLFSIFESDFNVNFILSFIGIGIMIASMTTFGFGMCMNLMDETADKSKGKNTSPSTEKHYYFLEKQSNFY